jgi:hypothetical protein
MVFERYLKPTAAPWPLDTSPQVADLLDHLDGKFRMILAIAGFRYRMGDLRQ